MQTGTASSPLDPLSLQPLSHSKAIESLRQKFETRRKTLEASREKRFELMVSKSDPPEGQKFLMPKNSPFFSIIAETICSPEGFLAGKYRAVLGHSASHGREDPRTETPKALP